MDRDHSLVGGIIVRKERHLLRPLEVRSSEIQGPNLQNIL